MPEREPGGSCTTFSNLPSEVTGLHFNHSLFIETVLKTNQDLRREEINSSWCESIKILEEHLKLELFFQSSLENIVCHSFICPVSFSSPSIISLSSFFFQLFFYKALARYCLKWVSAGGVAGSQIPQDLIYGVDIPLAVQPGPSGEGLQDKSLSHHNPGCTRYWSALGRWGLRDQRRATKFAS